MGKSRGDTHTQSQKFDGTGNDRDKRHLSHSRLEHVPNPSRSSLFAFDHRGVGKSRGDTHTHRVRSLMEQATAETRDIYRIAGSTMYQTLAVKPYCLDFWVGLCFLEGCHQSRGEVVFGAPLGDYKITIEYYDIYSIL